jgi:nitric oxide synthase oxygenase domain/subunit
MIGPCTQCISAQSVRSSFLEDDATRRASQRRCKRSSPGANRLRIRDRNLSLYIHELPNECVFEVSIEHPNRPALTARGYRWTIVDTHSVGQQFCTHVQREREQFGRERPAQWSWIGGLTGPTNPTWHLEMLDFLCEATGRTSIARTGF